MSIPSEPRRFQSQAAVLAYVEDMREMAETAEERQVVALVGRWAGWHQRWTACPTPANDRREELAWRQLRMVLAAMDVEDTWLDPRS